MGSPRLRKSSNDGHLVVGHARVILVVDECSADVRSSPTRSFGGSGPSLTIVSIYQDEEDGDRSSEYRLFAVPLLPNEEIEAILKSYGVDPAYAKGWAEMWRRVAPRFPCCGPKFA